MGGRPSSAPECTYIYMYHLSPGHHMVIIRMNINIHERCQFTREGIIHDKVIRVEIREVYILFLKRVDRVLR